MNAILIREEYENRLYQQPSLKAIRARDLNRSQQTSEMGLPKLIAMAMQDEATRGAITAFKGVRAYEARVDNLARRRLMREAISLTEEQTLVTQGIKAEQDFRNSVGTLTRKVRLNPDLKAYGEAARAVPFPAEILGDIPSYLNQDEQEAMTYLGWGPEHAMWKEIADKTREGKANKSLSQDDMTGLLENIEKSAPRLDYSLSPSHLHQNGILTIGGNDWLDDLIALAIFIFIVLPWLFWQFVYSNSPWIVDYILHTFGFGD